MTDVLVIGAGVIGCAAALALTKRGLSVSVLERGGPGEGASWAAAGILGAQAEADEDGPMVDLCLSSRSMYADWVTGIMQVTGIDVGYRQSGVLRLTFGHGKRETLAHEVGWQKKIGLSVQAIDGDEARALEPTLASEVDGGVRFADDARVDPPALMRALRIAAEGAGAQFRPGASVRRIVVERQRARGVLLEDGTKADAKWIVLTAGSWSALIDGAGLEPGTVRPARGQIVELVSTAPVLRHVVFGPGCYLSPREDGRVLVGSTTEFVGFVPGVTARAVRNLVTAAIRLVPALGDAAIGRTWSGFRPHTRDELPILGEGEIRNLVLATGHFRNGILLAPVTGEIVATIIAGEQPPLDLWPFSPGRPGMGNP